MTRDADVIVVGSGPAGVSVALPLVERGLRVTLVDGGAQPALDVPDGEVLALRQSDAAQYRWLLGADGHALRQQDASSPKLRAPTLAYAFADYATGNAIDAEGFALLGSLAVGGLSNAWGCGVARFAPADFGDAAIDAQELDAAFTAVAARIGVSGGTDDDLSAFFGLDADVRGAVALDALHARLAGVYRGARDGLQASGFRLGRARLAVLAQAQGARGACDGHGLCLWGCPQRAMYSSRQDLPRLAAHPGFEHRPGLVVEALVRDGDRWRVLLRGAGGNAGALAARRVVLAAGTIATTAIAMRSLPGFTSAPLAHLPMAAFALCLPRFLGSDRVPGPGVAQLAFTLDGDAPQETCGFTFSTHGLPVAEFLRHAPLSAATASAVFRALLPACIVANCFLPSRFLRSRIEARDGRVRVIGGEAPGLDAYADGVRRRLAASFRRLGAWLLPGSFTRGRLGADVHYAATMPMRRTPAIGECDAEGEVAGLPGVYVADGAALPSLPAKSHTLAIMANAHRVGVRMARRASSPG